MSHYTRIYLLPAEASEVVCQYEPEITVSCVIPERLRKVKTGNQLQMITTPSVIWMQKNVKVLNNRTGKPGDVYLYRLLEKTNKKIMAQDYLYATVQGHVCWGHDPKRLDPQSLREANVRYWAGTLSQAHFAPLNSNYYGKMYDIDMTKAIYGDKYLNFNPTEALLVSSNPILVKKFPTNIWTKVKDTNWIIYPIKKNDEKWVAKIDGKTIKFAEPNFELSLGAK